MCPVWIMSDFASSASAASPHRFFSCGNQLGALQTPAHTLGNRKQQAMLYSVLSYQHGCLETAPAPWSQLPLVQGRCIMYKSGQKDIGVEKLFLCWPAVAAVPATKPGLYGHCFATRHTKAFAGTPFHAQLFNTVSWANRPKCRCTPPAL